MTLHQEENSTRCINFSQFKTMRSQESCKELLSLFNTILSFETKPFLVILVSFGTLKQHGLLDHKMFIS